MNLPEDVIFNILLHLPVRWLLRFKCVCKDLCALIKSSVFKDAYLALRRARPVDDEILGLKLKQYDFGFYKNFLTGWYGDYESLALSASAPSSSSSSSNEFEISGNCSGWMMTIINHFNGVVCVKGENRGNDLEDNMKETWFDITLVNPALREFFKLPVPDLGDYFRCYMLGIGFGYDDANNEYKVVAIVALNLKDIALVYHLSTNSWKILGDMYDLVSHHNYMTENGEFLLSMCKQSIFFHGSIHWNLWSVPNDRILTFNLTTELFQEMLFPNGWSYDVDTTIPSLFTIDKSTLALVAFTRGSEDNSVAQVVDIWVMKEYGDSESWTKQYSISSLPSFRTPLCFWKKDKLLLERQDSRLICYDLFTGQVYEYEQCDPIDGSYDLSRAQQNEPGQCALNCEPLGWRLQLVTGHESFVSVKQV